MNPETRPPYIPGVCNIGRAEIKMRLLVGKICLAATAVLAVGLIALKVHPVWRLLLFFPAAVAAVGFLQAAWHFCARFGLGGVFNFGPDVGKTDTVQQAEDRRKDRLKALQILGLSALIGVLVAGGAYLLPF